jgi:predicted outer membrane repeat protein
VALCRDVRLGFSTAILALALSAGVPASATVLTVTSCGDTGAQNQLRDRINDAALSGDVINVPACVITLALPGVEDANAGGDLDIVAKSVTIVGAGPGRTVIDGGAIDRVFHVLTGSNLTLVGMTIRNGNAPMGGGGGIRGQGGSELTLTDVVVSGNQSTAGGGGVATEGLLTLDHVIVRGNVAATIGGGILTISSPSALITNSVVADNQGSDGGGIRSQGPMTLSKVAIQGNSALAGSGGGLLAQTNQVVMLGVVLARNTAAGGPDCAVSMGGSILVLAGTTVQTNCGLAPVFVGNPVLGSDVVVGAGAGGGPHVRAFDPKTGAEVSGFFAYDAGFAGGVRVAACALDVSDPAPEIVTGAGAGGGPHVKVFNDVTGGLVVTSGTIGSFFAYAPGFPGGVHVGCADVNLDGVPDVITGPGPGGGPHVRAFSGLTGADVFNAFTFPPAFTGGVFVGP